MRLQWTCPSLAQRSPISDPASRTRHGPRGMEGYVTLMSTAGVLKGAENRVMRTTAGVNWHFQNSHSGASIINHTCAELCCFSAPSSSVIARCGMAWSDWRPCSGVRGVHGVLPAPWEGSLVTALTIGLLRLAIRCDIAEPGPGLARRWFLDHSTAISLPCMASSASATASATGRGSNEPP
ncbi:hypothetical protein LIA77_02070 [Sarocladium implicatum]|nr:hypothetical protein LIA77_02070 [Sarocladium implicatum]